MSGIAPIIRSEDLPLRPYQRQGRTPRQRFGEAWERQTGEPGRAFSAFVIFRDLGPKRTLTELAKHPDAPTRTTRTLAGWSAMWHWNDRARAYDNALDRRRVEAQAEEIEAMARRHIALGMKFQGVADEYLDEMTEEQKEKLTPTSAARFAEIGVALERQGRGVNDENTVDLTVKVEIDPSTKAALFERIGQMAANIEAVRKLSPGTMIETTAEPVASEDEDGDEDL